METARWHLIEADDVVEQPWRNGLGVTRQIALWPPRASFQALDFEWRLSAAGVVEDGPFSSFAGFERVLLVTQGDGLVVQHGDGRRARLRLLEPYSFAGDGDTWASLVGGPIEDLGVLARRGFWRAEVDVLRLSNRRTRLELTPGEHTLVHLLAGTALLRLEGEEEAMPLERGDSGWILPSTRGLDAEVTGTDPKTLAVAVRLVPAG